MQVFVSRDPRFDDLSGQFNELYFKQSYGFLSDVKLREKQVLVHFFVFNFVISRLLTVFCLELCSCYH